MEEWLGAWIDLMGKKRATIIEEGKVKDFVTHMSLYKMRHALLKYDKEKKEIELLELV